MDGSETNGPGASSTPPAASANGSASGRSRLASRIPRPPVYRGQPYTAILFYVAAMAIYWLWRVSGKGLSGEDLMARWVFYAIIVIGFYIVFGVSGQFAFSQAAFAGLGAYTSVWAAKEHGFWLGMLAAIAVTSAVATVFALM